MPIPLEANASHIVSLVKQGFATAFIGFSLSTALYGVTILQVYLYYRNFPADRILWKCVVALLLTLDSLASAFAAHALYTDFVLNFGKSPVTDVVIPWSLSTEKLLVTLITFVAQAFYANAIWKVTVSKTITFSIAFLAVVCLALGIVTTVDIFTRTGLVGGAVGTPRFSIISGFVQGLAALDDLLITVVMCFHISHNSSGLPSTNKFVDTVILYTVSRGILTAMTQILFLITNVAFPGNTYYMPFHMCVGKLYVNGVLCTLNIRQSFRQKTEPQFDTGPAFSFFHPEGTEQSRSQPHPNNSVNSPTGSTNNPENEPKPSNLKVQS
ncbi:hypothetical protein MSAN_01427200 [Mycena sanguinolenta]|uniref:DUF6534 domain-containing protein n=1 Tax=Mycena sanguinolenta TaxID=230812 RepID=A0A8H6YB18_9AGAR|nr:hypothetical protein MSAN_01427200 [Mycena sanguinolenta]